MPVHARTHLVLGVSGIALASSHFHDVVLRVRKQAIETYVSAEPK